MATIKKEHKKSGIRYKVYVRIKGVCQVRRFRHRADAEAWARQTEAAIYAGTYNRPQCEQLSLAEALNTYASKVTPRKRITTQDREVRTIKAIATRIGHLTITQVTPQVLAAYRDKRLSEVSAYSVRLELALLSSLYQHGIREWGWVGVSNPVSSIARPSPPKGRTVFLTQAEAERLLQECRASRNRLLLPYVTLLLRTGMRPGEAASLLVRQIDTDARHIILPQTKNNTTRVIPISDSTLAMLRTIITGKGPDDYVFLSDGRPAVASSLAFRGAFEEARARAELSHVHLHDLRHTAASWLLMAGVDLRTLAEILGHQTMQMVMRYTHMLDEHRRSALELIERYTG